ncbi:MAG: sigma-70 family RNA polymerase sigma factor, partial [Rhodospirillales bacterium]|nr:sigma-70 family RNA polymerase sigma factor [Acetobacter sp.]
MGKNAVLREPEPPSQAAAPLPQRQEPRSQAEAVRPVQPTSQPMEGRPPAIPEAVLAEQRRMAELAYSCLLGDTFAWEALVRSQQRRVYALCYRFTGSASDAEDLTQDVFLKVYRNLASFDPAKASFGVWLTALTRNLLVDHYRRSRMERACESLDESASGDEEGPTRAERIPDTRSGQERHVAGVELRARIQAALTQVSPELREAVILRDLEDMDYRDIAETLCIPQGTVKSRISRGRGELARILQRE